MKPFIKWIGGKTQIIDTVMKYSPKEMENYHDIFLGGGSTLFAMLKSDNIIKGKIYAYDINEALISCYKNIQKHPEEVYKYLAIYASTYENSNSKSDYYYTIREKYRCFKKEVYKPEYSAMFLFLNKTCFRGMYREGPNGFNVPFGNYKNPKFLSKEEIKSISSFIKDVVFSCCDFKESLKYVECGDYVYADPPYYPEKKESFVNYTNKNFSLERHEELFNELEDLNEKGIKFTLSNSNVDYVKDVFTFYNIEEIIARRSIHCKNPSLTATELIISN